MGTTYILHRASVSRCRQEMQSMSRTSSSMRARTMPDPADKSALCSINNGLSSMIMIQVVEGQSGSSRIPREQFFPPAGRALCRESFNQAVPWSYQSCSTIQRNPQRCLEGRTTRIDRGLPDDEREFVDACQRKGTRAKGKERTYAAVSCLS